MSSEDDISVEIIEEILQEDINLRINGTIINDYITLAKGKESTNYKGFTDAPEIFLFATFGSLLSFLAGRGFGYQKSSKTKLIRRIKGIEDAISLEDLDIDIKILEGKGNICVWVLLIGDSRITRKSTTLEYVEDTIRDIDEDKLLANVSTPEAQKEQLSNDSYRYHSHDEASEILNLLTREYMKGSTDFESFTYEGKNYKYQIRDKIFDIKNPFVPKCWISTRYICTLFTEAQISQGYFNRYDLVVLDKEDRIGELKPERDFEKVPLTFEELQMMDKLAIFCEKLFRAKNVTFRYSKEATEILNHLSNYVTKKTIEEEYGLCHNYFSGSDLHVKKWSCVLTIGCLFNIDLLDEIIRANTGSETETKKKEEINTSKQGRIFVFTIPERIVKDAIRLVFRHFWKSFQRAVELKFEQPTDIIFSMKMQFFLDDLRKYLLRKNITEVQHTELTRFGLRKNTEGKPMYSSRELKEIIASLAMHGYIIIERKPMIGSTRDSNFYSLPTDEERDDVTIKREQSK